MIAEATVGEPGAAGHVMTDPYLGRCDQMFPRLTPAQVDRIAAVGERRGVRSGEVLFELGEQNTRFFVVIEGAVEIVRPLDGREEPIVVHGPGEFTGEINMLSARRALVRGRALGDGSIVVVDREHLRALVQRDFELSEILMRAFILRRVALIAHGDSGMVLIGSRHSARTLRIREFLSRNGQPFTYQEVESEPDVQALLDRFHVGVGEVPVVVCRGGQVLRNPSIEALASGLGLSAELDAAATRDVVIVGADRRVSRPRSTPRRRGSTCWCWRTSRPAARPARAHASRTISDSPPASPARTWPGARSCRPRSSARRWR